MNKQLYDDYVSILKEELVPAMGCTEPIALAYAASIAAKALGKIPETVEISVSANILKNIKSVIVPHTGSMRGIEAAACAGIIAGDSSLELEVLSRVTDSDVAEIQKYLGSHSIIVKQSDNGYVFDIQVLVNSGEDNAFVQISGSHTNVVRVERNHHIIFSKDYSEDRQTRITSRDVLTVEKIVEFADTVEINDIKDCIERQIKYNMAIAEEGLTGKWGASVGYVLLKAYGTGVANLAKATAAAGSDARMSGCELPVVINSGSGNQGMTASLPVIVYAKELGVDDETLYRALVVSNLITIHMKSGIGCLSAYCGATSAGCGAGAGVAYLYGGKYNEIAHTVVNAVAINSGMICDGAKPSCAAKIASAVEAGLLGMQMQSQGKEFVGGEGIVSKGVENTLSNISRLAKYGMAETDKEIVDIMISRHC